MMNLIASPKELASLFRAIVDSGQDNHFGDSAIFPEWRYWNATGNENRVDFPTIYWPKLLESEAIMVLNDE